MDEKFQVAVMLMHSLGQMGLSELRIGQTDFSEFGFLFPDKQLMPTEQITGFLSSLPSHSMTCLTDQAMVSYCILKLSENIYMIGPYREGKLRPYEAVEILQSLKISSERRQELLDYHNALALKTREDINIAARAIILSLHGDSPILHERSIEMCRDKLDQDMLAGLDLPVTTAEAIESRHDMEFYLMEQVAKGDFEAAVPAFHSIWNRVGRTYDKHIYNIEGFAVFRTLVRASAKRVGVPAAAINMLTESYRKRAYRLSGRDDFKTLCLQFLNDMCTTIRRHKTMNYSLAVRQAMDYIQRNTSGAITLENVAKEVGMAPTWLSTKFHAETGQTLTAYITVQRMATAANLLAFTNMNVQAVSAGVGILDSNYFSKIFRKAYHMTPMEFRRNPDYSVL